MIAAFARLIVTAGLLVGCIEIPDKDPPCIGHVTVMQGLYGDVNAVDVDGHRDSRPLKDVSVRAFVADAAVEATVSDRGGYFYLELAVGTYELLVGATSVEITIRNGDVLQVGYQVPASNLDVAEPQSGPVVAPSCH